MSNGNATARYPKQAPIDAYGDGGFRFAGMSHIGSLLCLKSGVHAWHATDPTDITLDSLKPLIDEANPADVLLIGTGVSQVLLNQELLVALKEMGLIIEFMATGAAARTYNVLLGEERQVAAALIAVGQPSDAHSSPGAPRHG